MKQLSNKSCGRTNCAHFKTIPDDSVLEKRDKIKMDLFYIDRAIFYQFIECGLKRTHALTLVGYDRFSKIMVSKNSLYKQKKAVTDTKKPLFIVKYQYIPTGC